MTETEIQIQVVMDYLYPLQKEKNNFEFFATLNEATLKASVGLSKQRRMYLIGLFKKMGMKVGIPDLVFLCQQARVFFIELKDDTGKLSENQLFRIPILENLGFNVYVCRSLDEVKDVLIIEGIG